MLLGIKICMFYKRNYVKSGCAIAGFRCSIFSLPIFGFCCLTKHRSDPCLHNVFHENSLVLRNFGIRNILSFYIFFCLSRCRLFHKYLFRLSFSNFCIFRLCLESFFFVFLILLIHTLFFSSAWGCLPQNRF